jgi:NAD(P)-dependent dehydrogenase (short-subunit alcohol dehydrogenase family)
MERTIKNFGTIDVLINNATTISQQSIASQSYEMSAAAAAFTYVPIEPEFMFLFKKIIQFIIRI